MGVIEAVNGSTLIGLLMLGIIIVAIIEGIEECGLLSTLKDLSCSVWGIFKFFGVMLLLLAAYTAGILIFAILLKKLDFALPSWLATGLAFLAGGMALISAGKTIDWIKTYINKN